MRKPLLDPAVWWAGLPTSYTSACLLLTDAEDRILLTKPYYRPYWVLPGGIADEGESPHACAAREIHEELGLTVPVGDLLVVDWLAPLGPRSRPMLNFIFDGGTVEDPSRIRLQDDELDDAVFVTWDHAATLLPAETAARVPAARRARKNRQTVYLPTGPADR